MAINLAKASLYLRTVGQSTAPYFVISSDGTSIEAGNFFSLGQGNPVIIFDNTDAGSIGSGYMRMLEIVNSVSIEYPTLTYPVQADIPGKYNVYARVKRTSNASSTIDFDVLLDGESIESYSISTTIDAWEWIQFQITIPSTQKTMLGIRLKTELALFNALHISTGTLPDTIAFSHPFITIHFRVFKLNNRFRPVSDFPIYQYKTTISELVRDDWYNFSLEPLVGNPSQDFDTNYAIALFCSGSSENNYIIWDFSEDYLLNIDPYNPICSLIYNTETKQWDTVCDKKYAIKMYTFQDSLDAEACQLVTPAAALTVTQIKKFDVASYEPQFVNTEIVSISTAENKVRLSLPDRIVSILVDQSGSMTWNDNPGLRHAITQRLINRVDSTYPGDVKWNIFSVEGTPIRLNFFAVVENDQIDTNDVNAAASSYFVDQESGFAGVRLIRKKGSPPQTPLDGEIIAEGFSDRALDENLTEGSDYHYKAFTFNADGTYSDGVDIEAVPRVREIPTGIGQFTANILKGSGVRLDDNVVAVWHLNEGSGNDVFDFSPNQNHLTSTDPFWLNNEDVPSGSSGLKFNRYDAGTFVGKDNRNSLSLLNSYTIMFWLYLPDNQTSGTILEVSNVTDTPHSKMAIGTSGNTVYFTTNYTNYRYSSTIQNNTWTHVAITVNETSHTVEFYINGVFDNTGTLPSFFSPNIPGISLGKSSLGLDNPAFARVTEISVHNVIRSAEYISAHSSTPDLITDKILDNGDRIIVLNYTVPDGANYLDGEARVIEKVAAGPALYHYTGVLNSNGTAEKKFDGFGDPPYHPNDGNVINTSVIASSGQYFFTVHDSFVHSRTYNFKIFSKNTVGNFSHWSDSPVLSVEIPAFSSDTVTNSDMRNEAVGATAIRPVQNVVIRAGNKKNFITWGSAFDSSVSQVIVYYSDIAYPIFGDHDVVTGASIVFNGTTDITEFVHRNIPNSKRAYYAIVAADRYGYKSSPVYFEAIPSANADEIGIPLLEVRKIRYEVVSETSLSIAWDKPVTFAKAISAYFDQRVALYAQITDEFGGPIADDSNIRFSATGRLTSAENAENVFGDTVDFNVALPQPQDTFLISSVSQGGGLIKGILRMTSDFDILSAVNQLIVTINVAFSIPDRNDPAINAFEYTSQPITITLNNPFKLELVNQNGDQVIHLCKDEVPLTDFKFIASGGTDFDPNREALFDGTYIRRERSFIARVKALYRDIPLPIGGVANVVVKQASDPRCQQRTTGDDGSSSAIPFIPSFSVLNSVDVLPPATTVGLQNGFSVDNGVQTTFSYADIPLTPPRLPEAVMLFVQVSHNGFTSRKKLYIVFENILRVETTVNEPAPNCVDQAEQFASVYVIDPNNPIVHTSVPDLQVCRWNLRKGITGKDRPFFSLDNVPAGPGVFSFVRSGTARKVFFGPACGVVWQIIDLGPEHGGSTLVPEMYAIKASVVYDGLTAFEERPLVISPDRGSNTFGSRFLMNFREVINDLWTDGYDFEKLTIYRDPNSAGGPFGEIFRECSTELNGQLFILNPGQIVDIETGADFEVLYGNNLKISLDPYIDEFVFSNNQQDIALANIPLSTSGDETYAYLRINKFIGPVTPPTTDPNNTDDSEGIQNICSGIDIPAGTVVDPMDKAIIGHAGIIVNGEQKFLNGGGDLRGGLPPTVLRLKEPLSIRVVGARREGLPITQLLVDGQTEHTFILEVSFSGKPVPNGTPITLSVGGDNPTKIQLTSSLIYTFQREDAFISDDVRSYASFAILPINPAESFSATITATTNYDKRGDVQRSMSACITISYDSTEVQTENTDTSHGSINSVFSSDLWSFNSGSSIWTKLPSMTHERGGLCLSAIVDGGGDALYAIGGLGSVSVTSFNERYDVAAQTWASKEPMSTPRFYAMSCIYNSKIYVFGGYTIDQGEISISRSVEMYDPTSDTWTTKADMPTIVTTPYGVSMGQCVVHGAYAYIASGIRSVASDGSVRSFNDRVLIYSFVDDTWTYTDVIPGEILTTYSRMSSFVCKKTSVASASVVGGAFIQFSNNVQSVGLCSDSYEIDFTNPLVPVITAADGLFSGPFLPRYKGNYATLNSNTYILGGSNLSSNTLRRFEKVPLPQPSTDILLTDAPFSAHSFGMSANDAFSSSDLYVVGGMTSGRPKGFAQINATVAPSLVRLDGIQSAGLNIEIKDETGQRISSPVRTLVRGYLIFAQNSTTGIAAGDSSSQQSSGSIVDRQALVYPVIFADNDFIIEHGFGSTSLEPRSDDILRQIDEIKRKLGITTTVVGEGSQDNTFKIVEGVTRFPYSIIIQITVVDSFYYGQTVVNLSDNDVSSSAATGGTSDGSSSSAGGTTSGSGTSTPGTSSGGGGNCTSFSASQVLSSAPGSNPVPGQGVIIQTGFVGNSLIFSLNPPQMPQLPSPSVRYFCDIDWIPQVIPLLNKNNSTAQDALQMLAKLRNSTPFGGSPLYDGLSKIAEALLADSAHNFGKIIYVNTDNEENLSLSSIDDVIQEIQAIDGFGETPVIVNNLSVVFPVTLSALVARTDTDTLERLASETGGQSQTILDASFIDEVLNNAIGRINGSIGWGMYEAIIDLKNVSVIRSISLQYELFENTEGNWTLSASDDGLAFGEESDIFDSADTASFTELSGRYLKFKVTLLSGLSASIVSEYEGIATPGVPALTGITIEYNVPEESFIFLNPETPDFSAQQIAVAVRSTESFNSILEVGAATSKSSNWSDFHNGSQRVVGNAGKIFIPIRTHQSDASLNEPLISVDGYIWKTKYGAWNPESRVTIKKDDGTYFDPSDFKSFARDGLIVFKQKQSGGITVDIENSSVTRLGIRIVNRESSNPVAIEGVGYFYNTNVFLPPPLAQRPPEARELAISPSTVGIYTKISASYKFFDINADLEDTSQTEIRWYINGVEIEYLRNLTTWNDISNTSDPLWIYGLGFQPSDVPAGMTPEQYARQIKVSILKVGDVVYFTVKPSDGKSLGAAYRSPSETVAASPPFVVNLSIKGLVGNAVQDTITTSTIAFADYNFFDDSSSDGSTNSSTIIWYVNGNEFKRGTLGDTTNGLSNNQLAPGEMKAGTAVKAIAIGNDLEVEIRPAAGAVIGNPVRSDTKTVQNSPPSVSGVVIQPAQPTTVTNLAVSYDFTDTDVASGVTLQSDQSAIKWFRQRRGQSAFEEVVTMANRNNVPNTLLNSGDQWYAEIIPFDGVSLGTTARSNTVTVG